jgi:hypothetical protein
MQLACLGSSLIDHVSSKTTRVVRRTGDSDEKYADIDAPKVVDLTHPPPTPQKGSAAKKRR